MGPSSLIARRCAAAVALLVFCAVAGLGLLTHHVKPLAVPAATAQRLGAQAREVRDIVTSATSAKTIYIDEDTVKVEWFRHGRAIATVGVRRDGTVYHPAVVPRERAGYGAPLTHGPIVLGGLTVLFLLATLRAPLRRRRTLDIAALAAFVVPTVLIDRGYLGWGEGTGAVLLAYLVVRGVQLSLRGPGPEDDPDAPVLLQRFATGRGLPRLPRQIALALLLATMLVTATSSGIVDVAFANMEGATLLLRGTLPYGHMSGDVLHGDTYGLPVYAIYAPLAAIWPVTSDWDDPVGSLLVGALAVGVCMLGVQRATRGARWPAIVATLAFPAALISSSSGTNDVLIAAALIWAFAWWTRPAASGALIMLAGLAKFAPLVLLPLWLARLRGAELRRAILACAAVGAIVLGALVAIGGLQGPVDMVHAMTFQLSRRSTMSLWTSLRLQAFQPLAQALALAVALGGAVLVLLDRAVATDPRRIAGLVAATLGALQLAANHWAPLYLLWLAPPAMVALLGPLGARTATVPDTVPTPAAAPVFAPA